MTTRALGSPCPEPRGSPRQTSTRRHSNTRERKMDQLAANLIQAGLTPGTLLQLTDADSIMQVIIIVCSQPCRSGQRLTFMTPNGDTFDWQYNDVMKMLAFGCLKKCGC